MKSYQALLNDVLTNGKPKHDRTGTGTISVFSREFRHKMSDGFPLVTTKKMSWKSIVTELIWFLKGDTNIKYLNDNGCTIWDEWADENGNLGNIYGKQWRNFNGIDQIQTLINNIKSNPDDRGLLVSAWNVGELNTMALRPCHYSFQVYTRELSIDERMELLRHYYSKHLDKINENDLDELNIPKRAISLKYNMRSSDLFLGKPFNTASYALLLCIIAKEVNMIPDELIASLGDVHLYNNHIEQAKLQLTREPYPLGTLEFSDEFHYLMDTDLSFGNKIRHFEPKMFKINNYKSHAAIKADISV